METIQVKHTVVKSFSSRTAGFKPIQYPKLTNLQVQGAAADAETKVNPWVHTRYTTTRPQKETTAFSTFYNLNLTAFHSSVLESIAEEFVVHKIEGLRDEGGMVPDTFLQVY